jgi:6-phosphogluconolactonase
MAAESAALRIFAGLAAATDAALELVLSAAAEAVAERDSFSIALSGGNTPADLYRRLAAPPAVERVRWPAVQVFFGDERCVPPGDPESNYGMVRRTLLAGAPVPAENVHRMAGELPPGVAAAMYEDELRNAFRLPHDALPRFDLILLGMGPDGHTASLFPHTAALVERQRIVVANRVPQLNTDRLTLTLSVLNHARQVMFLVAGGDKADALAAVLEGPPAPERYPAQSVRPTDGDLIWLVDEAAAAKLSRIS